MVIEKIKQMKSWKFIAILLIIDFTAGFVILDYNSKTSVETDEYSICETGVGYTHLGVRWNSFPISYYISNSINEFTTIIERSLDIWDRLTDADLFVKSSSKNNADLNINFGSVSLEGEVLGETQLYFQDQNSIYIEYSEIVFSDSHQFTELSFSCEIVALQGTIVFDLQSVAVHEIGHVLGLGHSDDLYNTMYYYYTGTYQKTLSQGDKDGLASLYPSLF